MPVSVVVGLPPLIATYFERVVVVSYASDNDLQAEDILIVHERAQWSMTPWREGERAR